VQIFVRRNGSTLKSGVSFFLALTHLSDGRTVKSLGATRPLFFP
jgi:hypothetical protein